MSALSKISFQVIFCLVRNIISSHFCYVENIVLSYFSCQKKKKKFKSFLPCPKYRFKAYSFCQKMSYLTFQKYIKVVGLLDSEDPLSMYLCMCVCVCVCVWSYSYCYTFSLSFCPSVHLSVRKILKVSTPFFISVFVSLRLAEYSTRGHSLKGIVKKLNNIFNKKTSLS